MTRRAALAIVSTEPAPPLAPVDDTSRIELKLATLRAGLLERDADVARLRDRHSQALDLFAVDPTDRNEQALQDLTQRLREAGERRRLLDDAVERLEGHLAEVARAQAREAARADVDRALELVDAKVAAAAELDRHLAAAVDAAARYAAIGNDCADRVQTAISLLHGSEVPRAHDALVMLLPRATGQSDSTAGALAGHFWRIADALGDPAPLTNYVAFNALATGLPTLALAAERDAAAVRKTLEATR